MVRIFVISVMILSMLATPGCKGAPDAAVTVDVEAVSPGDRDMKALELAEARKYKEAQREMELAFSADPTPRRHLGVAHLLFLNKEYAAALDGYRSILTSSDISEKQAGRLKEEIERIEAAGAKVSGASLAGQWVRSEMALLRAEQAMRNEDYETAHKHFDMAYQYSGEGELLLESAFAASKGELWARAHRKYTEYSAVEASRISPAMAFRIRAEIDRIGEILEGKEPVTRLSLADEIFAERSGEVTPEELPPSARTASSPVAVVDVKTEVEEPASEVSDLEEPELEEPDSDSDVVARMSPTEQQERLAEERRQKAEDKKAARQAKALARRVEKERIAKEKQEKAEEKAEAKADAKAKAEEAKTPDGKAPGEKSSTGGIRAVLPVALDDLIFYSRSRSSTVRMRAVQDLIPLPDERARFALEERMIQDRNMHIRFAAINGLAARRSNASLPVMRRATITAATSHERAVLKKAIDLILEEFR